MTQNQVRALALFGAPLAILLGVAIHPYVGNEIDLDRVTKTITDDPDRWALAHLILAFGMGLVLVSAVVLRRFLMDEGELRWSFIAFPFVLVGGTVVGSGFGGELAAAAVANAGGDVRAVMDAAEPWFNVLFGVGGLLFLVGWLCFAVAVYRGRPLADGLILPVAIAMVVVGVAPLVPHSIAGYVVAVALAIAEWPIGARWWSAERA